MMVFEEPVGERWGLGGWWCGVGREDAHGSLVSGTRWSAGCISCNGRRQGACKAVGEPNFPPHLTPTPEKRKKTMENNRSPPRPRGPNGPLKAIYIMAPVGCGGGTTPKGTLKAMVWTGWVLLPPRPSPLYMPRRPSRLATPRHWLGVRGRSPTSFPFG